MVKTATTESSEVRDNIVSVGQRIMASKGFSAVGLNEILTTAGVPKGSFYYYFASKDAFGEALLEKYFKDYLAELDVTLQQEGTPVADGLIAYFDKWRRNQLFSDCHGKCLVVKLGAEVADLSEPMRLTIKQGTAGIVARLAHAIERGTTEGSVKVDDEAGLAAESLYQLWLGASVMAKVTRDEAPFDAAMRTTRQVLHLPR
ncbi:TetR/AcrR family transcriptional regulator [Massilia sp.]|uniref:TetR/AcrR family transcriptional regulator n=1 Tax=Massilia sp. TaxID=1882437 RepID=UPI0028A153FA|nr:TetR/AcrR family transcriptional regulator [Massilia sp.]